MPAGKILIVAVDGLRASALGAYGNTTFPTPALDRFAAESLLMDACFALSPDLRLANKALWHSRHPLRSDATMEASSSTVFLPQWLADRGYRTTLITDEPELRLAPAAAGFANGIWLPVQEPRRAADVAQTALGHVFAGACDVVESGTRGPCLVWVHSRGMYGPWDAPLELQESLLDEGDPPPVATVEPPNLELTGREDPDAAFRYSCAYAAQIMALDACWEGLMEAANSVNGDDPWLVMLFGTRGFPLGEHRRIGGVDERLYADQLHVPWLIRSPNGNGRLARSAELVSHIDLLPTMIDSVNEESGTNAARKIDGKSLIPLLGDSRPRLREALCFGKPHGCRAIRTPAWSLLCNRPADDGATDEKGTTDCELYVRPDDRWEANDVAARCPEVTDGLACAMSAMASRIERGEPMPQDALPEELLAPIC